LKRQGIGPLISTAYSNAVMSMLHCNMPVALRK
jgi:hypothetical protein